MKAKLCEVHECFQLWSQESFDACAKASERVVQKKVVLVHRKFGEKKEAKKVPHEPILIFAGKEYVAYFLLDSLEFFPNRPLLLKL